MKLFVLIRYLTTFPVNALNQRNESGDLPLHIALKKPEPESVMICELLNRFPASAKEKDSTGNLPLFLACRNQKTSYGVIRLLLK
jgi:ankyrin repeat protein